jgi:hypothetical protein
VDGLSAALVGLAAAVAYFIPTLVGLRRRLLGLMALAAFNLAVGWTGLGWFIALVWAASGAPVSARRGDA